MYLAELTSHRFVELREQGVNTVLIPIGMLEAHGEHCALGTDTLIPREFARRLEPLVGDKVVIAPEIPYGHSWGLAPFPGTLDIPGQVFADYVTAVGTQLVKQGFRYVILLNGHGGNMAALTLVSERLSDLGAVVLSINWWVDYRDLIVEHAPEFGHAGEDETSCVLAIDPKLVEMEYAHRHISEAPKKIRFRGLQKLTYPHANNGDATKATAEKGEAIYKALIPAILRDIEEMWSYTPNA
ncbi:MAG: creatininase family protein [Alicyclobacillus sp.]|nr:creatininase family protein [Alicyclobacillus sp.]